ncbi:lasso RiPP family leader peptide-containing protein [Motilibacter aurantiacus]|nr:lasso RiPP family leader peptide-containing protein [Motilibacter aurantiacus]NHC45919.1 lasso RiPP family leader peptide-containing protein [Motilibacter aurantiacus]
MKDYVVPRLTVVGSLEELTARSNAGTSSDMPLAWRGTTFTAFS